MRSINRVLAVSMISTVFISGAFAQEDKSENQQKNVIKSQEQVTVKDQNQNQGETRNREQNRIIHGPNFVDVDKDGFNDNAPDHDGDGIPNGQDADYQGAGKGKRQQTFVDQDGDGIADQSVQGSGQGLRNGRNNNKGYGPADGSGNQGVRPQDGSGYGPGAKSGNCDGSGPKGKTSRGSQRR